MKIEKYKKGAKGTYQVFFDDGSVLSFYEEVILKYDLLLKKEISLELLHEANLSNQEWDVYYVALNSIKHRFRSVHELKQILLRKEYPMDLIDKAVSKLIDQGYLNDRSFAKSYINSQMLTTNKGPYKLEKELLEKGIDTSIIQDEISVFGEEEQLVRIDKLIQKGIKTNHNRGGVVLKQKIYNDLKNLGYDITFLNRSFSSYSFENDLDIARKEYEKLYRKYSRKYSGNELKRIVNEKLYQKGLRYEEK